MNTLNIPSQGMMPPSGLTGVDQHSHKSVRSTTPEGKTFSDVLSLTLAEQNLNIHFSSHAKQRLEMRNVDMGPEKLQKLDKAIDIAKNKGGRESLILMDGDAYVVNVDKRTVITAVNNLEGKGGVFTQIDSTVIM
jgi:flagellar operon protein